MTSALPLDARHDRTHLPHVLRMGAGLGLLQSVLITLFGFLQPRLDGTLELLICGAILVIGVAATIALPGLWTGARTIEGIAGAAGIGLMATVVFLVIDVALLQRIGLWTNRWHEIGGGSNWWYHPVWWMAGTLMPWLGAWVLANQTAKTGSPSPVALVLGSEGSGLSRLARQRCDVVASIPQLGSLPSLNVGAATAAAAYEIARRRLVEAD